MVLQLVRPWRWWILAPILASLASWPLSVPASSEAAGAGSEACCQPGANPGTQQQSLAAAAPPARAAQQRPRWPIPIGPISVRPPPVRPIPLQPVPVQRSDERSLARGKLLVASAELRDPNFARTVVLLIEHGEQGSMGVILNRATRIKLSDLLPRVQGLEQRGDTIYEGGPVERSEILMLLRAAEPPEDSSVVFGDIYLSASAGLLKRLAAESPHDGAPFRVYSGYAGWAVGQLEAEVGLGAWHILPASAAAVFTPRPEDLWRELIGNTTLRLAQAISPQYYSSSDWLPRAKIFRDAAGTPVKQGWALFPDLRLFLLRSENCRSGKTPALRYGRFWLRLGCAAGQGSGLPELHG